MSAPRSGRVEFAIVIAAVVCALTTALYGFAVALQGGLHIP